MKILKQFDNIIALSTDKALFFCDLGYQTVTTKKALNQFLDAHNVGQIYQQDKKWYYSTDKLNFTFIPVHQWFKISLKDNKNET